MKLTVKHFEELTALELYEVYQLRCAVFVVEQNCIYQDIDDADKVAYHLWLEDDTGIQAYARVLPAGLTFPEVSLGRVIAVQRRCGLGTEIVREAVRIAKEKFSAETITIEAQTYARGLYENIGFVQVSEEFLEDGIPHIKMQLSMH